MKTKMATGTDGRRLLFWCPGCATPHAPRVTGLKPWTWNGDREKPTLEPSVLVRGGEVAVCHSFVRGGQIQFLSDCTHTLAGKTVDIPDWPYDDFGGVDAEPVESKG